MSATREGLGAELPAEAAEVPNLDPRGVERTTLRSRLLGRLRGELSLARMRKRGLRAEAPVRIGQRTHIDANFLWAVEIGAHTIIANDVRIIAHDAAIKRVAGYMEVRPVKIGRRCYIGAGTIVLPGAVVGDGAIVGAGSLVRGEVPAGSVAVGAPAKPIATVEEFRDRHLAAMDSHPRFDRWRRSLDEAEFAELRRALAEHGRVYLY